VEWLDYYVSYCVPVIGDGDASDESDEEEEDAYMSKRRKREVRAGGSEGCVAHAEQLTVYPTPNTLSLHEVRVRGETYAT
jgi:hypothetical protein